MVESGGLENRCTFAGTVGSNPTLSAIKEQAEGIPLTGSCGNNWDAGSRVF